MTTTKSNEFTVSRAIAPEDIKQGVYVMIMHELHQIPIFKCAGLEPEITILQVAMRPYETEIPVKVVGVCLPYVVVDKAGKKTEMIDTRKTRLARVGKRFAKAARKPHEPSKEKKGKKAKKSRKDRKKKRK